VNAALLILLLVAQEPGSELRRALAASGVRTQGLGLAAGRAGGEPLLAVGADEPRAPASNQKILVGAAAIARLGRDFHFETRIAVGEGGDLVVAGEGDPNLSGRFFGGDPTKVLRAMARDVASKGVKRVRDLVLDASRFDNQYVHPEWPADQLERWYCAPVAALVYNDSCWDVRVLPGSAPGAPSRLLVEPSLLSPAVANRCETVRGGKQVVHIGRAEESAFEVRGQVVLASAGVAANVTVRDPVRFFGEAFRAALEAEGVPVDGEVREGRLEGAREILLYRSDLARTLKVMLTDSQNLYAECIFKRLGGGSFSSGAEALADALAALGVPTEGLDTRDGSGLSKENRVTARTVYGALQAMRDEPMFVAGLAAGGEGTLGKRYRDLGDRVRAKTGTIRGVSALSGYVTGRDGGRYVFAILANGPSTARARRLQDLVVTALAKCP
jgi:D-alanyl-D-alanine carboxypeptidase/D-alanyl-D-alanine-endopeptidase (penicillin-binding protein 4)